MSGQRVFRAVVSGALVYEALALQTDRLPTITAWQARHPVVAPVVVAWLVHHFRPTT